MKLCEGTVIDGCYLGAHYRTKLQHQRLHYDQTLLVSIFAVMYCAITDEVVTDMAVSSSDYDQMIVTVSTMTTTRNGLKIKLAATSLTCS